MTVPQTGLPLHHSLPLAKSTQCLLNIAWACVNEYIWAGFTHTSWVLFVSTFHQCPYSVVVTEMSVLSVEQLEACNTIQPDSWMVQNGSEEVQPALKPISSKWTKIKNKPICCWTMLKVTNGCVLIYSGHCHGNNTTVQVQLYNWELCIAVGSIEKNP